MTLSELGYTLPEGNKPSSLLGTLHQGTSVARIFIVDDDEADRVLLGTILEEAGHETLFAVDGQEALRAFKGAGIEVVITDLQMPNVHGLELITWLTEVSPRPAIIAISSTGADQLDMALALGADVTLTKPLDQEELLAAVARVASGEA